MWLTHFTGLYDVALRSRPAHVAEHLLYIAAGTLFWLPVLAPPPLRPLPYPARLFYLAIALPQGALIAMAINGARAPLYAHYVATEGWRNALVDQSNAAAVMWLFGGLVVFVAFLATLAVWAHRESERVVEGRDGARSSASGFAAYFADSRVWSKKPNGASGGAQHRSRRTSQCLFSASKPRATTPPPPSCATAGTYYRASQPIRMLFTQSMAASFRRLPAGSTSHCSPLPSKTRSIAPTRHLRTSTASR
jgi:hypothetical protein